ncbi:MAG: hypothetical protein LUE26_05470 [Alistipes sp.]|nr:hypothetical protein [Alistipes sp.]
MEKDTNTAYPIRNEGNGCEQKERDFEEVIEANPDGLDFEEMIEILLGDE